MHFLDSEDKGDLSNSYSEIDLNKNLGDQDCKQARSQSTDTVNIKDQSKN